MTIEYIEVHHTDRTVKTFFPLPLEHRKLIVGDLVKVRSGVRENEWGGIGRLYGRIGVVRAQADEDSRVAVEWASFHDGHNLTPVAKTHAPCSGWLVPEKYLEPA